MIERNGAKKTEIVDPGGRGDEVVERGGRGRVSTRETLEDGRGGEGREGREGRREGRRGGTSEANVTSQAGRGKERESPRAEKDVKDTSSPPLRPRTA